MSRSGYSDELDVLELGRYRAQVTSAIRGKRGQKFIQDLANALDEMSVKELHAGLFQEEGKFCAIGALGDKKGINLSELDLEDEDIAYLLSDKFNIAQQLAREVMFENDECFENTYKDGNYISYQKATPEFRWKYMRNWCDVNLNKEKI